MEKTNIRKRSTSIIFYISCIWVISMYWHICGPTLMRLNEMEISLFRKILLVFISILLCLGIGWLWWKFIRFSVHGSKKEKK